MLDPESLDPGIRETVSFLQENGFYPSEAGDASEDEDEYIRSLPHIFWSTDHDGLTAETDRLVELLRAVGVSVGPLGPENNVQIQATYDPVGPESAKYVVMLFNLNDRVLRAARENVEWT